MADADSDDEKHLGLSRQTAPLELLTSLLRDQPAFFTATDGDFRILYLNRVAAGVDPTSVVGTSVFDFVAPRDRALARAVFARVLASGGSESYEANAGPPEHLRHYLNVVSATTLPDGERGLTCLGVDITAQRRREDETERISRRLRMVSEITGLALWEWDLQKDVVTWDARMHEITGQDEPVGLGRFVDVCVHPDDRDLVMQQGSRTLESGRMDGDLARIVRPDGEVRWTMSSGRVEHDEAGRPVHMLGSTLDVTRQLAMEEQLRQAQKMQAVGNLTAGVAHNFNNMLMVLMPSLELVEEKVDADDRAMVRDAREAAARAAAMVRQLMTFSGQGQRGTRRARSLPGLVAESVRMARQTLGSRITIRTHEEPVPPVRCDEGALQQVLLNILINARDAYATQQTAEPVIDITIDRARRQSQVGPTKGAWTSYARVRVRDNAGGMTEAVRARVFEPFYTTKGPEQGTGLGLSTSYAIVRDHGGVLDCISTHGEGTEMQLWLPVDAEEARGTPTHEAGEPRPRVLLVDDDPTVRRVTRRILSRRYEVTAVDSVSEAERLLEEDARFDVALLDRSMPGGSGGTLIPALRERLPDARVLYFTGEHVNDAQEVDGVLAKPLSAEALLAGVQSALDER